MKAGVLLLAILLAPITGFADQLTNTRALEGLQTVKVVCDVNVGDPGLLLKRVQLIDETYTQMMDAGVVPLFIVAFRGPAVNYVSRGTKYVPPDSLAVKKEIQGWIAQFHENGLVLELCAIAARGQGVSYADILPEITVVQNGYISLVAYQNKGYALLPMD